MESIGIGIAAILLAAVVGGSVYIGARLLSRVRASTPDPETPAFLPETANLGNNQGAVVIARQGFKFEAANERARQILPRASWSVKTS